MHQSGSISVNSTTLRKKVPTTKKKQRTKNKNWIHAVSTAPSRNAVRVPQRSVSLFQFLPDNALYNIFEWLSPQPGTTGNRSRDALNLAATCRYVNEYYRYTFVVALNVSFQHNCHTADVVRALKRLPRVQKIEVSGPWMPDNCTLPVGNFVGFGRSTRALRVKSLCLGTYPAATAKGIRTIVETYRNLEHLDYNCTDADDDATAAIADNLCSSLQSLVLRGWSLSDASGAQLHKLFCLKSLTMKNCSELTDNAFRALSALHNLEELDINYSSISDTAMCELLPKLRKLRLLKLQFCCSITNDIFGSLPGSLTGLELRASTAVREGVPFSALEGLPNLTSFIACPCPSVNDLPFLAPVAPKLRVLHLSGVGVSDENAAHWVSQMPSLVELHLGNSAVSDQTARALSRLRKVTRVNLDGTVVTREGVMALAQGVACKSLELLTFYSRCISVADRDMYALVSAISRKGYGRVEFSDLRQRWRSRLTGNGLTNQHSQNVHKE